MPSFYVKTIYISQAEIVSSQTLVKETVGWSWLLGWVYSTCRRIRSSSLYQACSFARLVEAAGSILASSSHFNGHTFEYICKMFLLKKLVALLCSCKGALCYQLSVRESVQTCKIEISICDKQGLWTGWNEVRFFQSIWGPHLFTLMKRLEFGFPCSHKERMISVISQLIQSFAPVEWQLLDDFRRGRNDAQPWMQNLPAEMQCNESRIALPAPEWAWTLWMRQSKGTRAAPCQLPQERT